MRQPKVSNGLPRWARRETWLVHWQLRLFALWRAAHGRVLDMKAPWDDEIPTHAELMLTCWEVRQKWWHSFQGQDVRTFDDAIASAILALFPSSGPTRGGVDANDDAALGRESDALRHTPSNQSRDEDFTPARRGCDVSNTGGEALERDGQADQRLEIHVRAAVSLLVEDVRHAVTINRDAVLVALRDCRDLLHDIVVDSSTEAMDV